MRVLIIGTGDTGRAVATRLVTGGHEVTLYDVDTEAAERLATELGGVLHPAARVAVAETPSEAVPESDVVMLAGSHGSNLEIARKLGSELDGKLVVDLSSPRDALDARAGAAGAAGAETIRALQERLGIGPMPGWTLLAPGES